MKVGDLVHFKCIGAGKTDKPPYSQDGEWRIGIIVRKNYDHPTYMPFEVFHIFYRGEVFSALKDNCSLLQEVNQ